MDKEKITEYVQKYTDDAYKFAFIVTLSEDGAAAALREAVKEMTKKELWDVEDVKDELFALVYKHGINCGIPPMPAEEINARYGKKSDDFYSFIALPAKERARQHLIMYEDMSEADAEAVTYR